jgi:hypothetical protein
MDGMERSDVSKAWIGLAVRARIRTRRGDQYLVLGKLVEVNEEGMRIMVGSRSGEASGLQDASRYPWDCVGSVEPLVPP